MSLRPIAAQWFELVTLPKELARAIECLSRTGAVELEARSRASTRLLLSDLEDDLRACRELVRRYQHYWPPAAAVGRRRPEPPSETLKSAHMRLVAWAEQAEPVIAAIERLQLDSADLDQLRSALQCADDFPDIDLLSHAGPKLQVRLLAFPKETWLREIPSDVLVKRWQTPAASYELLVGRSSDITDIDAQLPALKARVIPLPSWLPPSSQEAIATITDRLAASAERRADLTAQLAALSERQQIAQALGDIALVGWLNEHAKELRGSERRAWVTGWTSDVTGAKLRHALDDCGLPYVLTLSNGPEGTSPPLVLSNPSWAQGFEVFARMLGTPGRYEADPSQIVAIIASSIFGFMFGDVGQGAIILIAGLMLRRRAPLASMLVPGGVMAVVFGTLFGSVFCREDVIPALWLRPLADPITILLIGIVAGSVIISIGLVLDAVQMHWRGEALRWWAQHAGLLVAYAGLMIAPLWQNGLLVVGVGAVWFIAGAAVLADKGRLAAIGGAVGAFVEQLLRLLVNTLSFARIGAFALAHAGLSVAIVAMAQAGGRVAYWIVLVVGNIVVIVLEGLVVSIQTTRLLLFEFFIRFLTGAGREFKPLPPPAIGKGTIHEQF